MQPSSQLGFERGGERSVGGGEQILGFAADAVLGQPLEKGNDLGLGQGAHETVDRLAVGESDHRRDRLNTHLRRNRGMLLDVHLDELDLALGRLDRFLEDRRQLLAGTAPVRPEIDQHRLALGFFNDVLDEGLRRRVFDRRFCSGRSSWLQHVAFCSSCALILLRSGPRSLAPDRSFSFEHNLIRKPERHFSGSCSVALSG